MVDRGSQSMENYLGYLHGLYPYLAPSSSSSGADARDAADLACSVAYYISPARPVISNFSVTDIWQL